MHYVIIGGDAAGMSAAMEIYRGDQDAEITILEKGAIYSYGQCGLPYVIDGRVSQLEDLIARPVEVFRDKYGMDTRTMHEVTNVDSTNKIVTGINLVTGEAFEISYDRLLIATGATPTMPPWPNASLNGIHTVKTIPQMQQLQQQLKKGQKVTVIGAGFIGLEMVEALTLFGAQVSLIYRGQSLMKELNPLISDKLLAEAKQQGVNVYLEEDVVSFEGDKRVEAVVTNKGSHESDMVIVATGVTPNTAMLEAQKLRNGAFIVNEKMETSVEDIYAAGDCASHFHRIKKQQDYVPLGSTANKQGRIAGKQMSGQHRHTFKGILGTTIFKFFNCTIGVSGVSTENPYHLKANHIASYYEQPEEIDLFISTNEAGVLTGIELMGKAGVDKRLDVFVTALYNEMKLEDLVDLDISYAPPFNGVWDPIQQVAKRYT